MRCNQVSIFIERFNDYVPKDYPGNVQRINVYCDDFQSIYAALAKANAMAINELNEYEEIGCRSYVHTNEFSKDYRDMHSVNSKDKGNYDDDLELKFTYEAAELREDRIWAYEHRNEILELISSIENKKNLKFELKEKFGLNDFQIRKLLSIRLDMLSRDDYLKDIEEQKELERRKNERKKGCDSDQMVRYYERKIRKEQKKLLEFNAYIVMAENYQDIISIISKNPSLQAYSSILEDKYGLDRSQAGLLKMLTVDDLVSVDKYRELIKKAEENIVAYQEYMKEFLDRAKIDNNA